MLLSLHAMLCMQLRLVNPDRVKAVCSQHDGSAVSFQQSAPAYALASMPSVSYLKQFLSLQNLKLAADLHIRTGSMLIASSPHSATANYNSPAPAEIST